MPDEINSPAQPVVPAAEPTTAPAPETPAQEAPAVEGAQPAA